MSASPWPAALAAAALGAVLAPAALPAQRVQLLEICEEATPLRLVGIDTQEGSVLLALPSGQPQIAGWLLELRRDATAAFLYPDRAPARRFGGSFGPGPVAAFLECGAACMQPTVWRPGRWEPLGPPLPRAAGATVHATWDGAGAAWVLDHAVGDEAGAVQARAWRLAAGAWTERGALTALAVGSPGVRPAPSEPAAVLSGTARFDGDQPPRPWILALPAVAGARRGTLVPLGRDSAALFTAEGRWFLTSDAGGSWREQLWTPWPRRGEPWTRGKDFWLDLPNGHAGPPLALIWQDERPGGGTAMWLTEGGSGEQATIGRLPRGELAHEIIRFADGEWTLLGGCRRDAQRAYLRLRSAADPAWRQLPIAPGWAREPKP